MTDQVKVGLIGTSWWADAIFLPVFAGYERATLAAICGRNRERADEMAAKYAIPQIFTDYRQMIERGNLDAVVVATPDDTHYPIVMAALDAGLHVLCEKPIALNAKHAKEMYEKAETVGIKHMVMYTWHWVPTVIRAKQLVDDGYLGRFYQGSSRWLGGYARSHDYQWRFDADRANGVLGDLGSHAIHLAQWFLGDVRAVSAHLGWYVQRDNPGGKPFRAANDAAWLHLEFVNGAHVQIELSTVTYKANQDKTEFALFGERGTIEVGWSFADGFLPYLRALQDGTDDVISDDRRIDFINYFKTESVGPRHFVDCILDDKPIYPGLYEGYKVQQVIDAALQSHESGCRVAIPT